ncbi:hypothetical protein [Flavivirga algicola]|uniref:Uncharacterized protein n=1 Tax=Flavivirga algicola TaxID=2729136 RepID=A0ABX1RXP3_9FLAO|nr:hypothetical protein [Flavivirga algicola]NMH87770.1 hypothetical protein [Flavivirga algicola]
MQKQIIKYSFLVVAISLSLLSCVKDVDFDQADDFEISPVVESSLIFFEGQANRFLLNTNEIVSIKDSVTVEFFNSNFIVDNLIKSEFVFEAVNSISKEFQVRVDLINDLELQVHSFTLTASPSTNGNDVLSDHTEVFENDKLEALKNTSKIVFTLSLLSGETINQSTLGRIKLQSKAVFYLNIGEEL